LDTTLLKSKKYVSAVGVFWAVSLAALLVYYVILVRPRAVILRDIKAKHQLKMQKWQLAQECGKIENKNQIREKLHFHRGKLDSYVADAARASGLVFEISKIAGDVGVSDFVYKYRDNSQSGSSKKEQQNISEGRINVTFTGNFVQFANFINRLERHKPAIFVDRFVITRSEKSDSKHEAQLALTFFVRNRDDGATAMLKDLKNNAF